MSPNTSRRALMMPPQYDPASCCFMVMLLLHGMCRADSWKMESRRHEPAALTSAVAPFLMPTRLADGLGIGSSLSGILPEYAPVDRVPRIRPRGADLGCIFCRYTLSQS